MNIEMNYQVNFTSEGTVSGESMRNLLEIFPELESRFTQRKNYDEYYFNDYSVFVAPYIVLKLALIDTVLFNGRTCTFIIK